MKRPLSSAEQVPVADILRIDRLRLARAPAKATRPMRWVTGRIVRVAQDVAA